MGNDLEAEEFKENTPRKSILRSVSGDDLGDWSTPQGMIQAVKKAKGLGKAIPKELAQALASTLKGVKGKGKGLETAAKSNPLEPVASSGWLNAKQISEKGKGPKEPVEVIDDSQPTGAEESSKEEEEEKSHPTDGHQSKRGKLKNCDQEGNESRSKKKNANEAEAAEDESKKKRNKKRPEAEENGEGMGGEGPHDDSNKRVKVQEDGEGEGEGKGTSASAHEEPTQVDMATRRQKKKTKYEVAPEQPVQGGGDDAFDTLLDGEALDGEEWQQEDLEELMDIEGMSAEEIRDAKKDGCPDARSVKGWRQKRLEECEAVVRTPRQYLYKHSWVKWAQRTWKQKRLEECEAVVKTPRQYFYKQHRQEKGNAKDEKSEKEGKPNPHDPVYFFTMRLQVLRLSVPTLSIGQSSPQNL